MLYIPIFPRGLLLYIPTFPRGLLGVLITIILVLSLKAAASSSVSRAQSLEEVGVSHNCGVSEEIRRGRERGRGHMTSHDLCGYVFVELTGLKGTYTGVPPEMRVMEE